MEFDRAFLAVPLIGLGRSGQLLEGRRAGVTASGRIRGAAAARIRPGPAGGICRQNSASTPGPGPIPGTGPCFGLGQRVIARHPLPVGELDEIPRLGSMPRGSGGGEGRRVGRLRHRLVRHPVQLQQRLQLLSLLGLRGGEITIRDRGRARPGLGGELSGDL